MLALLSSVDSVCTPGVQAWLLDSVCSKDRLSNAYRLPPTVLLKYTLSRMIPHECPRKPIYLTPRDIQSLTMHLTPRDTHHPRCVSSCGMCSTTRLRGRPPSCESCPGGEGSATWQNPDLRPRSARQLCTRFLTMPHYRRSLSFWSSYLYPILWQPIVYKCAPPSTHTMAGKAVSASQSHLRPLRILLLTTHDSPPTTHSPLLTTY